MSTRCTVIPITTAESISRTILAMQGHRRAEIVLERLKDSKGLANLGQVFLVFINTRYIDGSRLLGVFKSFIRAWDFVVTFVFIGALSLRAS